MSGALRLEQLNPGDWRQISANAHWASFGRPRSPDFDRIDYSLFVHDGARPCAYATLIEIDQESVYMQHGGAFPGTSKTTLTMRSYIMMTNWLKERYKTISTQISNLNIPMLKMAMAVGFVISGTELNEGELFLKMLWKKT